ncbi:MAG: class I SAM-dependent methyltransferase [Opitutales bacterium]
MPLSSISSSRALTSYAKVRRLIGWVRRNRSFQLGLGRIATLQYLDIGCGPKTHAQFINLDYSWYPQVDVCWDIRRGLPFRDQSLRGVFSEHCLEHFDLPEALILLREIRRVLQPGGTVRIIVPDGEIYLRTYLRHLNGDHHGRFPFQEADDQGKLWTPIASVNRLFYMDRAHPWGHRTIYDGELLSAALRECGFTGIQKCGFNLGRDRQLLIDSPSRQIESLYVEASVS